MWELGTMPRFGPHPALKVVLFSAGVAVAKVAITSPGHSLEILLLNSFRAGWVIVLGILEFSDLASDANRHAAIGRRLCVDLGVSALSRKPSVSSMSSGTSWSTKRLRS